jgi:hypothetical protein
MKTILDPSFRYTASYNTDLKKTFERIRRNQRKSSDKTVQAAAPTPIHVASIVRRSASGRS